MMMEKWRATPQFRVRVLALCSLFSDKSSYQITAVVLLVRGFYEYLSLAPSTCVYALSYPLLIHIDDKKE